jgi:3-hydroxyisobutyrate dehydrogenase-like beta-hydroxyacid dehydrogenase
VANVGFLGLGIMGAPMTLRLIRAGHRLTVWSHNRDKAAQFPAANHCALAETPVQVARQSEVVFLRVGDCAMSREVILGENGLIWTAKPGAMIVDCSTISPMASKEIAVELARTEIRFLDAPCTGSKAGAETGTLSFMVGGAVG